MTDGNEHNEHWERELVARLATAALKEQRRARLWGIFFKLLTFAYVTLILIMTVDWQARTDLGAGCRIAGPALVQEHGTTTVLFAGDALAMAPSGEMIIGVGGG